MYLGDTGRYFRGHLQQAGRLTYATGYIPSVSSKGTALSHAIEPRKEANVHTNPLFNEFAISHGNVLDVYPDIRVDVSKLRESAIGNSRHLRVVSFRTSIS